MSDLATIIIGIVTTLLTGAVTWVFKNVNRHSIDIAKNETRIELMETSFADRLDRIENKLDKLIQAK